MADADRSDVLTLYTARLYEIGKLYDESIEKLNKHQVVKDPEKLQQCHTLCKALLEHTDLPLQFQALANFYLSCGHDDEETIYQLQTAICILDRLRGLHGEELDCRNILYCLLHKTMGIQAQAEAEAGAESQYDNDWDEYDVSHPVSPSEEDRLQTVEADAEAESESTIWEVSCSATID